MTLLAENAATTIEIREPAVRAWAERVVIPTYRVPAPDRNPMFLERRVYQGSSGKVYPNPITDRVSDERVDKSYEAVFIENEYLRLMILPEIGGRIHIGQDKTNGYDFFYRQNVIKPALVGLLGPWISGGVEFNWPQHHRPSTFQPVHWEIEEAADGGKTVWLSEHEPMQRMKGMVGICLRPGKALVEARVRLYNRTPFTQTFLWWANVGVRVHDQYQAFFPPDVHFVADHARRAISSFPVARDFYYGVDYREGVDISWYKNIPVPTSYMVTRSNYDFVGGYDFRAQAGLVHVADRFIAPGKKLWTWGNAEFGYAWDRELTDSDGPYVELMAGVYTDNQPDFSWQLPLETKSFSQYWYPIQRIGPVKNANQRIAIALEREDGGLRAGACSTEIFENARIEVAAGSTALLKTRANLRPGAPFVARIEKPQSTGNLAITVFDAEGERLISWAEEDAFGPDAPPAVATAPPDPKEVETIEELYLTGVHLEQYRHATRSPESYWEEALRRDSLDSRSNTSMGLLLLRRGLFREAEGHFGRAIRRLTRRNANPPTGEPYYYLGLALLYQNRLEEAYRAFHKAVWNYEWRAAAYYQLACLQCRKQEWAAALAHVESALATGSENLKARNLRAAILRHRGQIEEARVAASATAQLDPLDFWARYELALLDPDRPQSARELFLAQTHGDVQLHLDLAFDYAAAGLLAEAEEMMTAVVAEPHDSTHPMVFYALAAFAAQGGDDRSAIAWGRVAAAAFPDYCFPARLEEMLALETALERNPSDARGQYYLGNLYYDKKRRESAISCWEKSVASDPGFSIPWRNLGIAYFNVRRDAARALDAYKKALAANTNDARLIYEYDQLRKRMNAPPEERLRFLEEHGDQVDQRDDLVLERATLLNQAGRSAEALQALLARRFHPWEGGEGLVSGQYVWAHRLLGIAALAQKQPADALEHSRAARIYPRTLGEGKHLLTEEADLDYVSGLALGNLGRAEEARDAFARAADARAATPWMAYYKALALRKLGDDLSASTVFQSMRERLAAERAKPACVDYFATSLPNLLLFDDDLERRREIECDFAEALLDLGAGRHDQAAARLREVLKRDPNHLPARFEFVTLQANVGKPATTERTA